MAGPLYRQVAVGKRLPAYVRSARHKLDISQLCDISTEELWRIHDNIASPAKSTSGLSVLDLKIELASRMMQSCSLCERKCSVDRTNGQTGFCRVGNECRYSFEQILWGEEAPLVPSHEIFFTGCNMRCRFCYSWESVIDPTKGKLSQPEDIACLIDKRRLEGAVNVNLIGGDPTVNLLPILLVLKHIKNPTAIVWNSNFYMSEATMKLLNGIVDLYVADFRFGNNECAQKIANTDRYFDTASRNLMIAGQSGELIVRHLLIPGHIDCCLSRISAWMAQNLPKKPFNLMFQYAPFFGALADEELNRSPTSEEQRIASKLVQSFGLNTARWNRPLKGIEYRQAGSGEITTTIMIRPDGQVSVMHLHSSLMEIVEAIETGGQPR